MLHLELNTDFTLGLCCDAPNWYNGHILHSSVMPKAIFFVWFRAYSVHLFALLALFLALKFTLASHARVL